ncbi:MAG: ABC transporter permease subunit [Acidobacteriota bacterium]
MSLVVIAETFRRHATSLAYFGYLGLLALLSMGVSLFDRPAAAWPSLITLLALVTGSGAIGPEFSSGTLQLILVKPLTRVAYLLSRVTGIVLVIWLAAVVCAVFEIAGRAFWGHSAPITAIGSGLLNVMADTVLAVSLLALLGSITRAYFNIAIYLFVLIGLSVTEVVLGFIRQSGNALGQFLAQHTGIDRVVIAIESNLFPDAPTSLEPRWMVMVLSNAAVALLLACLAFRRREVPYGAD